MYLSVACGNIGVRGSRTGYSIPGRDGNGAGSDLEILPPPPSPSPPAGMALKELKYQKNKILRKSQNQVTV